MARSSNQPKDEADSGSVQSALPAYPVHPVTAQPSNWVGPIGAGILGSLVLASFGFAALLGIVGAEQQVGAGVGAGLGQAAHQVAEGEGPTWDRWPIAYTAVLQIPLWVGLLGPLVWAARKHKVPFEDLVRWRFTAKDVVIGLVVGLILQLAVPVVYNLAFSLVGERDVGGPARELAARANGPGIVALILITVVGAPIIEEVFYRGFLQPLMNAWMPQWAALVVASAVFGAIHFQVLQFPALFVFALVAGGWVLRSGGIGRSIWTHVGFNATSIFLLLLFS